MIFQMSRKKVTVATYSALPQILNPTVEVDSLTDRCKDCGVCRVHQDGWRLRQLQFLLQSGCCFVVEGPWRGDSGLYNVKYITVCLTISKSFSEYICLSCSPDILYLFL